VCCCDVFTDQQGHKAAAAAASDADAQSIQSVTPSSVKVAVVVRPLLPFEQQRGGSSSVVVYPPDKVSPGTKAPRRAQQSAAHSSPLQLLM
jgi:hypothetical protein